MQLRIASTLFTSSFMCLTLACADDSSSFTTTTTTDTVGTDDSATSATTGSADTGTPSKGVVELPQTVVVELQGDGTAEVTLPFSTPLPITDAAVLQPIVETNVTLELLNETTEVTVSLATGVYVDDTPDADNEWTWAATGDGSSVTFTFFNMTDMGQTFMVGGNYAGTISVTENAYVETLPATNFDITVQEAGAGSTSSASESSTGAGESGTGTAG